MKRLLFLVLLGATGAYFFRAYCFEGIYVASESMEPAFPKDTHVMVNKFSFWNKKPARGNVIMFESPIEPGKGLIKRIIGVGGDTIEIREKRVYIDGKRLDEPYVQFLHPESMYLGDNVLPFLVPEDTLFVMGDNRDVSGDSRDWRDSAGRRIPFLPLSKVKGLVQ